MEQKKVDFIVPFENPIFKWDEQAYDLTKEKGQVGAILFCEEMIQDILKEINQMQVYNKEKVTALHNSIMNWCAIKESVKKGFNPAAHR